MHDQKETPEQLSGQTESYAGEQIEGQTARITRYSKAKRQADSHAQYIHEHIDEFQGKERSHLVGAYDKLLSCGNYLLFRHYYTVDQVRLAKAHFCKNHFLCPLCAIRRGAKGLRVYVERFLYLKSQNPALRASLVTLTMKNGPDLEERFKCLCDGLKKISRVIQNAKRSKRPKNEFAKFKGHVGSIEIKRGKNSGEWHPHCHLIVLHDQDIDSQKLSDEWLNITGDSFIVDCQPIRHPDNPAQDFVEVFKYALKFSSMDTADLIHAWQTIKRLGNQLLFSAGILRGVKIPEDLTDDLIEDLPYIELMYRFEAGNYQLKETKRVNP